MKGWLLLISVTLVIGAASWLWSRMDWQGAQPPQAESPAASGDTAMPSPGARPRAEPGTEQATRETNTSQRAPGSASAHLDPLFAALAMHRPPEPREAPDFTLPDVDGRPVRLRALRGKLVFLNFWATWCPPCRLEMPGMERLYQTFKETAFAMLAVSIDRQGGEAVRPFMAELHLTFPALLDQKSDVARQYGLRGLPTTYLIDPEGWLIGAAVGGRDWDRPEAKALIAGLLRQVPTAANDLASNPSAAGR